MSQAQSPSPIFSAESASAPSFAAATSRAAAARPSIIEQRFVVENECHGWRLDRFLQKRIRRLSRSRIQRVIEGDCDVDGRVARSGMRVFSGQLVSFRRPAPPEPDVPREFSVVLADPSFYVIDKPAGLPIHPTGRYHFSTLTAVMRERFPGESLQVAHRLDRETSGLLLVARTAQAASVLKTAFQKRLIRKRYLAIAHGHPAQDHVVLEQPIGPAGSLVRVRMAVRSLEEGGLPSRTDVQVLGRSRRYSLLECRPFTGRQHQIRVHLDAIGHPIVGDKLYPDETVFLRWIARGGGIAEIEGESDGESDERLGTLPQADPGLDAEAEHVLPDEDDVESHVERLQETADPARTAEEELGLELPRHALHAAGLVFPHPISGEPVTAESPLPQDLADFFASDG
ncbi:MAG: RluA family pseudouridine synthase [Myxococcales bacterium]|nr:RluA family pseudouridine synthase [Myxococcales bacterium]